MIFLGAAVPLGDTVCAHAHISCVSEAPTSIALSVSSCC